MRFTIRPADLECDRRHLISLLRRHLRPATDDRGFDWLYRESPFGPARAWLAWDDSRLEPIGMAALFPRTMYVADREETGCVMGDFCISEGSRTLGPALQLQRACIAEIGSGTWAFAYDLPSSSMMAVYRRLAIRPRGKFIRFAKPLRVDEKIRNVVGRGPVARALSAGTNVLLSAIDFHRAIPAGTEVAGHRGLCDEEFSRLAQRVGTTYGNCTVRSAAYLNWRYVGHPFRSYEIITARRAGALCGYVVFSQFDMKAVVADLLAVSQPPIIEVLLGELIFRLRTRGFTTLSCMCLHSSTLVPMLRSTGFREREVSPLLLWQPRRAATDLAPVDCRNWLLLEGDRES